MNQRTDDSTEPEDATDPHNDATEPPEPPADREAADGETEAPSVAEPSAPPDEERSAAPLTGEPPAERKPDNGDAAVPPVGEPSARDEPAPYEAPAAPARRGRSALAWLALLVALASLAAVGWVAWQGQGRESDIEERIAANARAIEAATGEAGDAGSAVAALRREIEALDRAGRQRADELAAARRALAELRSAGDALAPRLAELEDTMNTLQGISAGAREAWMLSEAEYYMRIANAELALVRRPEVALRALELADDRLRRLASPALGEVRRALAGEMQSLRALEPVDIEGMTYALASLAERAATLPLAVEDARPGAGGTARPAAAAEEDGRLDRAMASVRRAFSGLISVRRADESARPLMSPEAARFLETNLALNFEAARLALLRGEPAVFRATLRDAREWIERYYDTGDRAVVQALGSIAELASAEIVAAMPDVSESLELLRQYRARRELEAPGDESER